MDSSPSPLPNPVAYLNYLDPTIAFNYEVTRNVYFATLGAFVWDILSSVPQDWKLLCTSKPRPVFIAYHLSRLGSLIFIILSVLEYTGPIENCNNVKTIATAFGVVSFASSDFLFLVRVCAVYHRQRTVRIAFIVLWIVDTAVLSLLFSGLEVIPIASTKHCINISGSKYIVVPQLVTLIFDTMVYMFITVKLLSTRKSDEKMTWWAIFSRNSLPRLSYAIMQGGQQYYLIKVAGGVINTFFWLIPSVPPVYRVAAAMPMAGLNSSMACRVYRNLKLELMDKEKQGTQKPGVDAVFTTCVQIPPLTEVLTVKDVEATTNGHGRSVQIVESSSDGMTSAEHLRRYPF